MSAASNYLENEVLDHILAVGAYSAPAGVYVKLHLGDPGEDCTSNPAAETTRIQATFAAASGGSAVQSGTAVWGTVSTTENVTHFSAWDAATSGNPLFYGSLNNGGTVSLTAGDGLELTGLTVSLA